MNADLLLYMGVPWEGLLSVFVLHVALARSGSMNFLGAAKGAAALGTVSMLILQGVVAVVLRPLPAADAWGYVIVNGVIYTALLYIYVNFVNMGETARRIRILRELVEAPQGLTSGELLARYNARGIVATRLKRLSATGQIVPGADGRWRARTGSIMLFTARFVQRMKVFFLGVPRRRT